MIKIIKEGTRKVKECENCGCLFSYDNEDISASFDPLIGCSVQCIECPQCSSTIYFSRTK